jgi:uncharacterized membrane protein YfcA
MFELGFVIIITLVICAFLCEYLDSTLGMGYGTTLTPVFLLMGFSPMEIVPAVLSSELITGLFAGIFHHCEGNVNFKPETADVFKITNMLNPLGYIEGFRKTVPLHLKIALLLGICSIVGMIVAVFIAVSIPEFWLKLYIGCLVLAMGIVILGCLNKRFKFSWKKITFLGLIASFNKGMSGGGYGPVITGGQILSGVEGKSAVGITSLSEGLTCLVGVVAYALIAKNPVDWKLAPYIIIGAMLSVPLSAKSIKWISTKKLKIAIAILTMFLGLFTIIRTVALRI